MLDNIIDIITFAAKFWFLAIAVLILVRVVDNSVFEFNVKREIKNSGAGLTLGYLTIVAAGDEAMLGERFHLKWENSIGSGKRSDVYIKDGSVSKNHALLYLSRGKAYILPSSRQMLMINDERATGHQPLNDADEISLGNVKLRLRLEREELS